ncbi:6-bladed beta-propeller protein [Belliella buryatensis]|uniref:6-bladed beta-propeller protein n=1 Tax=Belliella buryatensis TaxID=1500549 RepID=A0A239FV19_9BACT|nr:6-bladed beta-propeller [Belliella buryatensis]SNS59982.1 6-bladed beta-propeller protein [Belliella buryatensis]
MKLFIQILFCLVLLSCNRTKPQNEDIIASLKATSISDLKAASFSLASDFFDSGYLVILEENPAAKTRISEIKNVVQFEEKIYLQGVGQFPLSKFDKSGKFISEIGKIGQGPEEYSEITSFTINKEKKLIYIYDQWLSKLLVFNLNGEFQFEKIIRLGNIYAKGEYLYVQNPANANEKGRLEKNRVEVYDYQLNELIYSDLEIELHNLNSVAEYNVFSEKGDTLIIHPPSSFELIYLKNNKIVKHIENIESPIFPTLEERIKYVDLVLKREPSQSGQFINGEIQKSSGLMSLFYFNNKELAVFNFANKLFYKGVKNNMNLTSYGILDDIVSSNADIKPITTTDGYLVSVLKPDHFHTINSTSLEIRKSNFQKFYALNNLKYDDRIDNLLGAVKQTASKHFTNKYDEPPFSLLFLK